MLTRFHDGEVCERPQSAIQTSTITLRPITKPSTTAFAIENGGGSYGGCRRFGVCFDRFAITPSPFETTFTPGISFCSMIAIVLARTDFSKKGRRPMPAPL